MYLEYVKLNLCNFLLGLKGFRCVFEIFYDNIFRILDEKLLLIVLFNYYFWDYGLIMIV